MGKMVPEMKVLTGEIRGNHLHSTQIPLFTSCLAHFISKYYFEKKRKTTDQRKTFINFGKSNGEDKTFEYNSLMNLVKNQRII